MPVPRRRVRRHGGPRASRAHARAARRYVLRHVAASGANRFAGAARSRPRRPADCFRRGSGCRPDIRTCRPDIRASPRAPRRGAGAVPGVQGTRGSAPVQVAGLEGAGQAGGWVLPPRGFRGQRRVKRGVKRRELGRVRRVFQFNRQAARRGVHRASFPGARRARVAQAGARGGGRGGRGEGAHRGGASEVVAVQAAAVGPAHARGARGVRVLRHRPRGWCRVLRARLRSAVAVEAGYHTRDVRAEEHSAGGRRDRRDHVGGERNVRAGGHRAARERGSAAGRRRSS